MDLEQELQRLKKPEPSEKFCQEAKVRLMHKIILHKNESLFLRLFKRVFKVDPSQSFLQAARIRLLSRIEAIKQPIFSWLLFTKRLVATTLVMTIAVASTLFFVGGKQPVRASENTFLEVLGGEVAVKHADRLIWDVISGQTELAVGDLIRLGDSASAVVHFFDDSQLRLAENSSLLLSRLDVSPGYARQGIIGVSLHQGRAWVQTLNVDDGYAGFSLITRDAIVSTRNTSFDAQTNLFEPTTIRVFKHNVDIRVLREESRDIFASGKLNSYQRITLEAVTPYQRSTDLTQFALITDLTEADREEAWVINNLEADRHHLAELRERELINLRLATGALPGQVLYPVKRAKERLNLALRFNNEESQTNMQISMANQRLSEAIVLIEQGETEKAKLALMEYQNLVRQIAEEGASEMLDRDQLSNQIVAAHQKTLVAALPGDAQIGIVKQVLDQTEEFLAENPIERAGIRLQNSLEDIIQVQDLIVAGDLEGAKEALVNHEILASILLEEAAQFEFIDEEQKKGLYNQILEIQYEERRILSEIAREFSDQGTDSQLVALVENADVNLREEIKHTAAIIRPLFPDVVLSQAVALPKEEKVLEFVEKINIYSTWQGQKNQISRLLAKYPQYARDMNFLMKVRDRLDSRAKDIINLHILQLNRELAELKSKMVKRKIDRAIRLREQRSE